MRVSKWGNSLAIRLPSPIVKALELKEGDNVEIQIAGRKNFQVKKDRTREQALEALRKLSRPFPKGFVFDREEAHER